MSFYKKVVKTAKNPVTIGVLILFTSIFIIVFASKILYDRTVDLLTENLRERITIVSTIIASNIDAESVNALQTQEDWRKPQWSEVVNHLHHAKYSNDDIVFMYIFRKTSTDPSQMEFVADADSINPFANTGEDSTQYVDVNRDGKIEPDGPDKLQWPGQPYPEAVDIPETYKAYEAPIASKDLYTDEYGTVITGYAPIKDKNGMTVAVLATDIKADDFFTITTQTLIPFLIFIVSLTLIISLLTIAIIITFKRYTKFLERVDKEKTEFISLATHQIRGPLGAIKGHASLALEGDYGPIGEGARKAFETIMQVSEGLVVIVSDYLDVSRIEQGRMKYDFTQFDLKDLIKEVVAEFQSTLADKPLTLTFTGDENQSYTVYADKGKIRQVFGNLIDNSIKYTLNGQISVKLVRNGGKLLTSIKDTGVGIKQEVLPNLFQKFSRASDASKTNIMGTGLGLFVAKKMIEAHNGRVWAESEGQGKGSQFYVELAERKG